MNCVTILGCQARFDERFEFFHVCFPKLLIRRQLLFIEKKHYVRRRHMTTQPIGIHLQLCVVQQGVR